MNMIRKGDSAALAELIENTSALQIGVLADDQLRQLKNTFIVVATLASRAAIQGGMISDDAFTLSDAYIQKCEMLNSYYQLTNLRYLMILDFAKHGNWLHNGNQTAQLIIDVSNYVRHHMSEVISVEAMAKDFYMSRSYLSRRFKAESNTTLTDFLLPDIFLAFFGNTLRFRLANTD